jgi:hypothetical protein
MKRKIMMGINEPKPARNFPPGRVRWIMRNDCLVKAAVRTPEGLRIFPVWDAGDAWEPFLDCEEASSTRAIYGPAEAAPAGMVTLPVADFAAMAAELAQVKRELERKKRNASQWLKERNEGRAEVERLSKPMMFRVTMGDDEKISSIGGVTLEDVTVTEYPATETEFPRFEVSGVVRQGGEG